MPWAWVLPAVAVVIAFRYVATGAGTWYAFTDWDGISRHANWVGLDNFRKILDDPASRGALEHTLELALTFVVVVERDRPRARARAAADDQVAAGSYGRSSSCPSS